MIVPGASHTVTMSGTCELALLVGEYSGGRWRDMFLG